MRTSTSRLRPVPSPNGTNHERMYFDARGRAFRLGPLAQDAAYEPNPNGEPDPFGRLRVFLSDFVPDDPAFQSQLQTFLDACGDDRDADVPGVGKGRKAGAQDDEGDPDDAELRRMLKEVPGLSAADAERICGIVADRTKRAKDGMPANGMTPYTPYTKATPAMDSAGMASLRKIVPNIDEIGVGPSFGS